MVADDLMSSAGVVKADFVRLQDAEAAVGTARTAERERAARIAMRVMLDYENKPLEMLLIYAEAIASAIRQEPHD